MHRPLFLAAALTILTLPAFAQLPPCANCPCTCEEEEQGPERVFFGYLHAHTSYSDGEGTPREAYVHARDRGGLDFLALTPHNHRDAGKIATQPDLYNGDGPDALVAIAAEMTVDGSFVALYGQEFSSISKGNHVGVLDAPTVIDTANGEYDDLVNDYLPAHPDSTGETPLLVLNHPDSGPRSREYGRDDFGGEDAWVAAMDPLASILNLINGPSHSSGTAEIPAPEEGSFRFFLNKGFHVAPSIDQDNHRRTWGTLHDGRTGVVAAELTKPAILAALRARHAYATTDRNLRIVCRVQDGLCGDVFTEIDEGDELDIVLELADDDEPAATYQVEVYADEIGGPSFSFEDPIEVRLHEGDGPLEIDNMRYHGGREYYVFRITQFDEGDDTSDRAWLAPVWFEPPGLPELASTAFTTVPDAVAAVDSELFHRESCPIAEGIAEEDRVRGSEATAGRVAHHGCVGHEDER